MNLAQSLPCNPFDLRIRLTGYMCVVNLTNRRTAHRDHVGMLGACFDGRLGQIRKAEPLCGSRVTRRPFGPRAASRGRLVNAAALGSPFYGMVLICARAKRKLRTGPFVLTSMALMS